MFKSVFAKYISAFMLTIFVSFLVLVIVITVSINRYAVTAKRDVLATASKTTALFLGDRMSSADANPAQFKSTVDECRVDLDRVLLAMAATSENISVFVVDFSGDVLRRANGDSVNTSSAEVPRPIMNEITDGREDNELLEEMEIFGQMQYYCAEPVVATDGVTVCGYVFASAPSAALDELLGMMVKTVIIASAWIMLAALVLVYAISARVISPLRSMSSMAKSFAAGDFNARVNVRGKDEVAELGVAFNNMASSLSQLETMRNTFIANVSHDLRTPMMTISGFIDNILSGAIPPERQEYYLGMIKTEVQRLARLVSSLLDISRIQAGDRKFLMKPFDICEMGRLILISFEQKIEAKKLDVRFECDDERMLVSADYDAIYQVLYNICNNAVKFAREEGILRLRITFTEDGKQVLVSVYNEGEGIAEEDLPFVFERFYKADKSRGVDKTGVGLGLFISKAIIDAHHQHILVKSELHKYCEFLFTLSVVGGKAHT